MSNIEEIFKASLENNEMPYDLKSWEAMSSRLDQAMPVNPAKKFPKWGWAASASVVILAGITALYFSGSENNPVKTIQTQLTTASPAAAQDETPNENDAKEISVVTPEKLSETSTKKVSTGETQTTSSSDVFSVDQYITPPSYKVIPPVENPEKGTSGIASIALPKSNDKYCESEKAQFTNPNKVSIQLTNENGSVFTIAGSQTISVELSAPGEYFYIYQDKGKAVRNHAFYVIPKPKADFYANDQTLYDEGLPFNRLESNTAAEKYTWTNEKGEVLSREKEFSAHLYTKGKHNITLTTEGSNGCKNEVIKAVKCDITYNLLAMTGFNPASSDARNSTFIPYALIERKVPFEMQIIDPKDGHIVYETKDASQPWTGIDRKTNQMIPDQTTYIWKVTLLEKAVGEPNRTYQGLITRFSNN